MGYGDSGTYDADKCNTSGVPEARGIYRLDRSVKYLSSVVYNYRSSGGDVDELAKSAMAAFGALIRVLTIYHRICQRDDKHG